MHSSQASLAAVIAVLHWLDNVVIFVENGFISLSTLVSICLTAKLLIAEKQLSCIFDHSTITNY